MRYPFICCLFFFPLFAEENTSSFFWNTDKELLKEIYGSDQEHYVNASSRIIQSIVEKMHEAKRRGETAHFLSEILPWLGKERGKLAKELRSKDAHLFGALRERSLYRDLTFLTPLAGPFYEVAGFTLLRSIEKTLRDHGLDFSGMGLFPFQNTQFNDVQRVDLWFYTRGDLELLVKEIHKKFVADDPFHKNFLLGGEEERNLFRSIEENDWAHIIAGVNFFDELERIETTENTLYLVWKSSMEIGSEEIPLSKVLIQLEVDRKTGDLFKIYPPLLLHQETLYTKAMLLEMDRLIESILLSFDQDYTYQIGLFRYLFAHAIPFTRGSAAVGEWLETALYQFLGSTDFCQNSKTTIDLEVFSSLSFKEFMIKYRKLVNKQDT